MNERPADDSPTLGETMNRDLYLDPGFTAEHPSLVDALRDDQDETVVRAQAAVDKRRAEAAEAADIADFGEQSADQP